MKEEKERFSAKILLMAAVFTCSMSSIFFKYMTAPSSVAAAYRLGFTVFLLTPAVVFRKKTRQELLSLSRRDVGFCLLSGVFLALHFFSWFESLNHTSITSSTVLVNTEVLFAAFGYLVFFRKRLKKEELGAIAVAFFGSVLIAFSDSGEGGHALLGDFLALAAAFFTAVYTLIGVRERDHISTTVYTYVLYWGSFLTLVAMNLAFGTPLLGYGPINWAMSFCLAVFCTLFGHSVFSWCLKYLAPTYVSTAKLAEPVFASLVALALFGEIPGPMQLLGATVVLYGVYLYAKHS